MEENRAFLSTPETLPAYDHSERPSTREGDRTRAASQTPQWHNDGQVDGQDDAEGSSQASDNDQEGTRDPKPAPRTTTSTTLHRSPYILFVVLIYASLATASWIIICVLAYKPINMKTYSFSNRLGFLPENGYARNEEIFRAMRVIQALVGVLTIPITSSACACAAVAYIQHNKYSLGMTMRQTIALADRGWTDPTTFFKIFTSLRDYKTIASRFLLLAMALHFIGGIIQPLQQVLSTTKTIKTPTGTSQILYNLLDTPDQFGYPIYPSEEENELTVLMTREALSSIKLTEPISQLWPGDGFDCTTVSALNASSSIHTFEANANACGYGATLGIFNWARVPFLAELPSTFTSGLIRQFAPRFNSSAQYAAVNESLYPHDCANVEGGYFVRYESGLNNTETPWFFEVCMPSNQRQSPWARTRARQDFEEELFVNVSQNALKSRGSIYRLSVNTTGGYFELPNDLNGGIPGPLLEKDPWHYCDRQCQGQGMRWDSDGFEQSRDIWDHSDPKERSADYYPDKRKRSISSASNATAISKVQNKGPLLTIALALFGPGSFINTRVLYPSPLIDAAQRLPHDTCTGFAPLHFFLRDAHGFTSWEASDDPGCIISNATLSARAVDLQVRTWIRIFDNVNNVKLSLAMKAAAFLATKAWMDNQVSSYAHSLTVGYDWGSETLIPSISLAGVIVISALYLVFLLSLLGMAAYASLTPRWTHSLDAFTMMRFGAAMGGEKVPLLVGRKQRTVSALDDTPGWVGDGCEDEDVGRLSLGAESALKRKRRYACYNGDHEYVWQQTMTREHFMAHRTPEIRRNLAHTRHVR